MPTTMSEPECSLMMRNLSAACNFSGSNPSDIQDFFHPVKIRSCEFLYVDKKSDMSIWKITFSGNQDLKQSLKDKQWKIFQGRSIRLARLDEKPAEQEKISWIFILSYFQLEILSQVDVRQGGRLRRVCKNWSSVLESFMDQGETRALFLDFASVAEENLRSTVSRIFSNVGCLGNEMYGRTTVLVLKFAGGISPMDAYLYDMEEGKSGVVENFLLRHAHIHTVVLTGLRFTEGQLIWDLFRVSDTFYWPREMKVLLHNCELQLSYNFPPVKLILSTMRFPLDDSSAKELHFKIPVRNCALVIGPETDDRVCYTRLHRELDKQRTFWPFPPDYLHWLKTVLRSCAFDNHDVESGILGRQGATLCRTIRRYMDLDDTREMVSQWEPTGVFFQGTQLHFPFCFFLSFLFVEIGVSEDRLYMQEFRSDVPVAEGRRFFLPSHDQ